MTEAEFAAALLDLRRLVSAGLIRSDGQPAGRRSAVYRNNIALGLTEDLRTGFPVVEKLEGAAFLSAMAGVLLHRHPAEGRMMMLDGDALPEFLATLPPLAAYPYLPEVALLEQAMRERYHASDAEALPGEPLATLPEATLLAGRLSFAPAVQLILSTWPVHSIWRANAQGGPKPVSGPEDVLILRPDFDPLPHLLPAGSCTLMRHLRERTTLAQAVLAAGPTLELTAVPTLLLSGGAKTGADR